MKPYLIVALGSGLGGALRHLVNVVVPTFLGTTFPYHTLTVNVVGSFATGWLAGYFALSGNGPQSWKLFLITGILGGFTTFSAFSLDSALLYERGEMAAAAIYIVTSVCVSIVALFAGLYLGRAFA